MPGQTLKQLVVLAVPFLVLIVHVAWRFWLRTRPTVRKANPDAGRTVFQPMQEIRAFFLLTAFLIVCFFAYCWSSCEPRERWLGYVCFGLLLGLAFLYPRTLVIDMQGLVSRHWLGREKCIRWEDVAELHYVMDKRSLKVRDKENRTIVHRIFHPEPVRFRDFVRERTRLPLKITHRRSLKSRTIELPYRDQR